MEYGFIGLGGGDNVFRWEESSFTGGVIEANVAGKWVAMPIGQREGEMGIVISAHHLSHRDDMVNDEGGMPFDVGEDTKVVEAGPVVIVKGDMVVEVGVTAPASNGLSWGIVGTVGLVGGLVEGGAEWFVGEVDEDIMGFGLGEVTVDSEGITQIGFAREGGSEFKILVGEDLD